MSFAIFVLSWSVVMAWVAEHARFSALPGILTHWTINSLSTIVWAFFPALSHDVMPGGLNGSLAAMVVAIGFATLGGMSRGPPTTQALSDGLAPVHALNHELTDAA